jgi:hypothetical protein
MQQDCHYRHYYLQNYRRPSRQKLVSIHQRGHLVRTIPIILSISPSYTGILLYPLSRTVDRTLATLISFGTARISVKWHDESRNGMNSQIELVELGSVR